MGFRGARISLAIRQSNMEIDNIKMVWDFNIHTESHQNYKAWNCGSWQA